MLNYHDTIIILNNIFTPITHKKKKKKNHIIMYDNN